MLTVPFVMASHNDVDNGVNLAVAYADAKDKYRPAIPVVPFATNASEVISTVHVSDEFAYKQAIKTSFLPGTPPIV